MNTNVIEAIRKELGQQGYYDSNSNLIVDEGQTSNLNHRCKLPNYTSNICLSSDFIVRSVETPPKPVGILIISCWDNITTSYKTIKDVKQEIEDISQCFTYDDIFGMPIGLKSNNLEVITYVVKDGIASNMNLSYIPTWKSLTSFGHVLKQSPIDYVKVNEELGNVIRCECGGDKLSIPHSTWCPKY